MAGKAISENVVTKKAAAGTVVAGLLGPAHRCVRCRELPLRPFDPADADPDVEYRPAKPRPIAPGCGPRTQRCVTHKREVDNAAKDRQAAARSRRRSGLDETTRQAVLALQGGVCAGCGRGPGSKRVLPADHCHELARTHDHAEELACPECFRGFLCGRDNRDILGLLFAQKGATTESVITVLRNLASYLEDPPMRRYLRSLNDQEMESA